METSGVYLAEMVTRWLHVVAGILWIGLLYFFNFVNSNFAKTLDADSKKKVVPELMPRALFFFRWGAMFTFLLGLLLIYFVYLSPTGARHGSFMTNPILIGVIFGTIMWFNVWFIIWPAQRKIINGIKTGNPAAPELVTRATNASKVNTYLSIPLVFFMLSGPHLSFLTLDMASNWIWILVIVAIGFALAWHLYKIGAKVSTNV
ncbi:MAG TPA: urate hydroxylase PuuD [bacterium]|nr:urate hydroxylase PuuD [bacterium]